MMLNVSKDSLTESLEIVCDANSFGVTITDVRRSIVLEKRNQKYQQKKRKLANVKAAVTTMELTVSLV